MLAIFNRVFKCLESIQKDIKVMKAEQIKIQSQLSEMCNQEGPVNNFTLPTGISIPVETDSDLIQLNSNLRGEKSLTAALCLAKVLFCNIVAWAEKEKKHFEHVEEVYNAILTAAALKFKEAGREELAEKFGRVLASACDWEGSILNKKTSECAENIDKLC
ncbi:hypothetical protein AVEN_266404-1 [Araneus ventricosus]|uniref:Uncharacterized protein n=1 Tax=Araneus ventricosus TaxID=182803 RepID=A0A4Y2F8I5_ARAVE|nr:hypothetical protein AVEN_266404-1 [Araneus ventricosus]